MKLILNGRKFATVTGSIEFTDVTTSIYKASTTMGETTIEVSTVDAIGPDYNDGAVDPRGLGAQSRFCGKYIPDPSGFAPGEYCTERPGHYGECRVDD